MLDWINQKFAINLQPEGLEHIKDFSLIWNVFERLVCGTSYNVKTAEVAIGTRQFNMNDFQEHLHYFRNRYVTQDHLNDRYPHLLLRQNDREDLVADVLLGTQRPDQEQILAMLIIIGRYRNNLFHGLKHISAIQEQNENFRVANHFLTNLLNYF